MLILAIEEQPGVPKTYKVIVDGKVVSEHPYRGTALMQLAEELDKKMFPRRYGD